MQDKFELRKFAKDFRKTLNIKEVSEKILQIFLNTEFYKNSKNIGLYYPIGNELDLTPILKNSEKNFFLPKININDEMFFAKYESNNLINGKYNIPEPASFEKIDLNILDVIIVPALMVDKKGYRLGYGKGYYDKLFNHSNFTGTKITFIPEKLFVDSLPIDTNDMPVDVVVTENQVYKII